MPTGVYKRTRYHKEINHLCHLGHQHSISTRYKMSTTRRASGNAFFGKRHSLKTCKIMSSLKLGKPLSEQHKAKLREVALRGESSHFWKGGVSQDRQHRRLWHKVHTAKKYPGEMPTQVLQMLYEDNIKHFGTLTCVYCKQPISFGEDTLDHKVPKTRGGTNEYDNLAIACQRCNNTKHTQTYDEFISK